MGFDFKDVIILEERKLSKKLETNVNKRHQNGSLLRKMKYI